MRWLALVGLCTVIALAGCGGDTTVINNEGDSGAAASTTTVTTTPTETQSPPVTAGDQGASSSSSSSASPPIIFQTPSHNIGCRLGVDGVYCVIVKASWDVPGDTEGCGQETGRNMNIDADGTLLGCGIQDSPTGQILNYGDRLVAGDFSCSSAEDGLSCAGAGHSLFLSMQRYELK